MKNTLLTILLLILSLTIMTAQHFSKHQWLHRILVLQYDEANQKNYTQQLRDLQAHQAGPTERKLVVYQFCDEQFRMGLYEKGEWKKADTAVLKRLKMNSNRDFSVTLMGLDGGVKLQQSEVLTTEELFGIIDSMPMRAREMRE